MYLYVVVLICLYCAFNRPLKLYYCPPKPGDIWPPVGGNSGIKPTGVSSSSTGNGSGGSANAPGGLHREKCEKPPGGRKLFMGNLSCKFVTCFLCFIYNKAMAWEYISKLVCYIIILYR